MFNVLEEQFNVQRSKFNVSVKTGYGIFSCVPTLNLELGTLNRNFYRRKNFYV